MALHCEADEMLGRAKDLFARGQHNEALALAIDAAAVFEQSGNAAGANAARSLAAMIGAQRSGDAPG